MTAAVPVGSHAARRRRSRGYIPNKDVMGGRRSHDRVTHRLKACTESVWGARSGQKVRTAPHAHYGSPRDVLVKLMKADLTLSRQQPDRSDSGAYIVQVRIEECNQESPHPRSLE